MPKGKKKKEVENEKGLEKTHHKFEAAIVKNLHEFSNMQLLIDDKKEDEGLTPWVHKRRKQRTPQIQSPEMKRSRSQFFIQNKNVGNLQLKKIGNINKIQELGLLKPITTQSSYSFPNIQNRFKKQSLQLRTKSLALKKISSPQKQDFGKIQLPSLKIKKNYEREDKKESIQKIVRFRKKAQSVLNLARIEHHDANNFLWKQCTRKF